MDNTITPPERRLLPTLVVFAFVLLLLYSMFLVFEKMNLASSVKELAADKEELQTKIDTLKEDKVAELFAAQELKDKLKDATVYWSKVFGALDGITPVGVFLSTYSASGDGSIQISGMADGFASVAGLIADMNKSEKFDGAFVPSLTSGITSDGQSVASFNLEVNFSEK